MQQIIAAIIITIENKLLTPTPSGTHFRRRTILIVNLICKCFLCDFFSHSFAYNINECFVFNLDFLVLKKKTYCTHAFVLTHNVYEAWRLLEMVGDLKECIRIFCRNNIIGNFRLSFVFSCSKIINKKNLSLMKKISFII